jgi:hypothetical protein
VVVVALAGGCGGGSSSGEEVVGTIEAIQKNGAGQTESLTVIESDGTRRRIYVRPDLDYGFGPAGLAHLDVHLDGDLPVRCVVERRDGRLVAVEIFDA